MLKAGDIVKYATPAPGEERCRFVVVEAHYDVPVPRARVRLLDSGMQIEPEEVLSIEELRQVPH